MKGRLHHGIPDVSAVLTSTGDQSGLISNRHDSFADGDGVAAVQIVVLVLVDGWHVVVRDVLTSFS